MRKGRFKKAHISREQLLVLGPKIKEKMNPLFKSYETGQLDPAQLTLIYILAFITELYPKTFLGSKIKSDFKTSEGDFFKLIPWIKHPQLRNISFEQFLSSYTLRGIPSSINQTLIKWNKGEYPLILFFNVPLPDEVFKIQYQGKRIVTLFNGIEQLSKYVLNERDPLSFAIHDLEHAHEFFSREHVYQGQLSFYEFILPFMSNLKVLEARSTDQQFKDEFEYAISDMNAYCVHLLKYFIESFKELEKRNPQYRHLFFEVTSKNLSSEALNIIEKIYRNEKICDNETIVLEKFIHDQKNSNSSSPSHPSLHWEDRIS